jgi:type 1 glutamine amidotransferase
MGSSVLVRAARPLLALLAFCGGIAPVSANARVMLDCPQRDAPFSLVSPFIDLLLNSQARAVIDREAPGLLDRMPARFAGTSTPNFAAILTFPDAARFAHIDPARVTAVGAALKAITVTDADRVARCARYDDDRPDLKWPAGKRRVLLFEKITGFRDGPSVDAAHAAFLTMARDKGWAITATDKGGAITPTTLAKVDVVIWNNVSGDVLTLSQRAALRSFVERGGGFVAVHGSGGDPAYFWDWYADDLIGARFIGHPNLKQFQPARVVVDPAAGPVAKGLPADWTMTDEWYSFAASPRRHGAHIVATLDEASYDPTTSMGITLRMGDHPIVWTRCVGRGRSFYSAIGHRPETYAEPHYRLLLENAVAWAAAGRGSGCSGAAG